jgi:hypothetical protein
LVQTDCRVTFAWQLHWPSNLNGATATGRIPLPLRLQWEGSFIVPLGVGKDPG